MSAAPSSDRASRSCSSGDRRALAAARATASAPRRELARELGVSRPAVREAVRLLVRANLLRAARGPGGGVFVAQEPRRRPRADGQRRDRRHARRHGHDLGGRADRGPGRCSRCRSPGSPPSARRRRRSRRSGGSLDEAERGCRRRGRPARDRHPLSPHDRRGGRQPGRRARSIAWSSEVLQPRLKDLIAPAIVEAVAREQHREIVDGDRGARARRSPSARCALICGTSPTCSRRSGRWMRRRRRHGREAR